jgi:hypothetical protein
VVTPDGAERAPRPRVDNAIVKALARAFRWRRMIESGRYANLTELAGAEKVTLTYLTRILNLALLEPDLVEAILDGRQPAASRCNHKRSRCQSGGRSSASRWLRPPGYEGRPEELDWPALLVDT